jgi:hypothetical protein
MLKVDYYWKLKVTEMIIDLLNDGLNYIVNWEQVFKVVIIIKMGGQKLFYIYFLRERLVYFNIGYKICVL